MASNIIDCYIKLASGKTVTLNLTPSDTIQKACTQIAEQEKVPADRVNLKYQGKVLQKTHSMGYLGVCKETILKAEIIQVKPLDIFVRTPSGKTLPVTIENVSPIRYIKDAIHTQESIDPANQVLKISGRVLSNGNQKCLDAGVTNESILTLEVVERPTSAKKINAKKSSRKGSTSSGGSGAGDEEVEPGTTQIPDTDEADEELTQKLLGTFDTQGRNVEVAFSFDTTGSMYSCLDQVRTKLKETVTRLIQAIPNMRIAIMAHGDYCDYNKYVVKCQDFSNDVDTLVKFVGQVASTGGGDSPECYEWCLKKAQQLDWSEDSAKAFVVIGDDIPHPPSMTDQHINWHEEIDLLKGQGVKIYGVRAQHSSHAVPFYQEISEHTGGAYIEFKNFRVITEMFLAVCYKEAGEEQFEQFREEMEQNVTEGTVNEEVKDILNQIDKAEEKAQEDKPKRYVGEPWWDPTMDTRTIPQYSYKAESDTWGVYYQSSSSKPTERSASTRAVTRTTHTTEPTWKSRLSRTFSLKSRRDRPTSAPIKTDSNKKGCVVM